MLSPQDMESLHEMRLSRLAESYAELLDLNQKLMNTDPLRIETSFDQASDTITVDSGESAIRIKRNRANPDKPITLAESSAGGAYKAGSSPNEPLETSGLKARLESELEGFYQSAHRILKVIRRVSQTRKVEARAIAIVRNKLVEHPEIGEFYSFGWSTNGPVVRPMHRPGREWVDRGLISNAKEFSEAVCRAFEAGSAAP